MNKRLPAGLLPAALLFLLSYVLAARWLGPLTIRTWLPLFLLQAGALALGFGWWRRTEKRQRVEASRRIVNKLSALDPDDPAGSQPDHLSEESLQQNLDTLLERIGENYQASRQFTQNAAHELQTPLAVIKSNVELLLQSPNLSEAEAQALAAILHNTNRLSRLNQALILLSRIEHRRFSDDEEIDIKTTTEAVLDNFRDLIQLQGLKVRFRADAPIRLVMSPTLAEILIANLVQNAIRHNRAGGYLDIHLQDRRFSITNPGAKLTVSPEVLFRRFQRESTSEDSLGLGLSIVKRICDRYGFKVTYHHQDGIHRLIVDFSADPKQSRAR